MAKVADGGLPRISLTDDEQRAYDSQALTLLHRTLAELNASLGNVDKTKWTLVRKRNRMGVYKNVEANMQKPGVTLMLGAGLMPGTVDDVMNGLYCDETDELRTVKTLLQYKFIDGAVLNVSERRSAEHPYRFAGIKWFAAKAAVGKLVKDRDLLTYERMGETRDAKGDPVAYHIYQSVDRPEWPANTLKNTKRAHTSTCYLYRKHSQDLVECFFWGEFTASGNVAQYVSDYTMAGKWLAVSNSTRCAEAKKLSQLMQSAHNKRISSSVHCDLCNSKPALFGSGHLRCGGCLKTVCKSCSRERRVFQMNRRTAKPQTELFCVLCIQSAVSLVPHFKCPPEVDTIIQETTSAGAKTDRDVDTFAQSSSSESDCNSCGDSSDLFELLLDLTMSSIDDDVSDSDLSEDDWTDYAGGE